MLLRLGEDLLLFTKLSLVVFFVMVLIRIFNILCIVFIDSLIFSSTLCRYHSIALGGYKSGGDDLLVWWVGLWWQDRFLSNCAHLILIRGAASSYQNMKSNVMLLIMSLAIRLLIRLLLVSTYYYRLFINPLGRFALVMHNYLSQIVLWWGVLYTTVAQLGDHILKVASCWLGLLWAAVELLLERKLGRRSQSSALWEHLGMKLSPLVPIGMPTKLGVLIRWNHGRLLLQLAKLEWSVR